MPDGRSKERYRRIVLNTLAGLTGRGVSILVNLLTVPLALTYLGKEQYGLFAAITSLLTWVTLFDFGIVNGLVNSISEAYGKNDRAAAASYVSTAFFLLIAIVILIALVFILTVPVVPWDTVFAVRDAFDDTLVRWSVIAAVVAVLIRMPLSVVPQIYKGYQKTYVASAFLIIGSLTTLGSLWLAIRFGATLPVLIFVLGVASSVALSLNLLYTTKVEMPWLRLRLSLFSRQAIRRLLNTSAPLFLFQIGALLVNQTQLIILAHEADLTTVTDYSILMRLYTALGSLLTMATSPFAPSFREAFVRGDHAWVRSGFRRMMLLRMSLAALAASLLVAIGNWILRFWLRQTEVNFGIEIWVAVGVMIVSAAWSTGFSDLLTIMDHIWIQVGLVVINGIVTVLLTLWLSPLMGVLGAIIAISFVAVAMLSWLSPILARSILQR